MLVPNMLQARSLRSLSLGATLLLSIPMTSFAQRDQPLTLELPLNCRFGGNCFIQQYFDHDGSTAAKDFRCGPMSYDGHDGTDMRLPTMAEQKKGVEIVAAAAGVVRGTRDGMDDISVRIAGPDSVKGRECGNGVVVTHPGGWETQYCHMEKGSVRVRNGQSVAAGTVLGRVGISGDAEFPHLHFSVRHGTEKVDPFAWGAAPEACSGGKSLWSDKAAAQLAYHSPDIANTGFASMPVNMDDVESGRAGESKPAADSPNLIAFVRAIGLRKGDVQILTLRGPGGAALASVQVPPLDSNKAQWLQFVGKKRTTDAWLRGAYEAQYEVKRDGVSALIRRFEFDLR